MVKLYENEAFLRGNLNYRLVISTICTSLETMIAIKSPKWNKNLSENPQASSPKPSTEASSSSAVLKGLLSSDEEIFDFTERQANSVEQGYVRHDVEGDGNCGYTAFGITRDAAYEYVRAAAEAEDPAVIERLGLAIPEVLITKNFYDYLRDRGIISEDVGFEQMFDEEKRRDFARDPRIIAAFIDYDIRDKRVELGWAHPATLQALAHIRNIRLRIWQLDDDDCLIPHEDPRYVDYTPSDYDSMTDLLYLGNHFERLDIHGDETDLYLEPIPPLRPDELKESSLGYESIQNKIEAAITALRKYKKDQWIITANKAINGFEAGSSDASQFRILFNCSSQITMQETIDLLQKTHMDMMRALLDGFRQRDPEDASSHRRWYYWNQAYLQNQRAWLIKIARLFEINTEAFERESVALVTRLDQEIKREVTAVTTAYFTCQRAYKVYKNTHREDLRWHAIETLRSFIREVAKASEFEFFQKNKQNLQEILIDFARDASIQEAFEVLKKAQEIDYGLQKFESQQIDLSARLKLAEQTQQESERLRKKWEDVQQMKNANSFKRFFLGIRFLWRYRKDKETWAPIGTWIRENKWKFAGLITLGILALGASIALPVAAPFLIPIGTAWTVGEVVLVASAVTTFVGVATSTVVTFAGLAGREVVPFRSDELLRLEREVEDAERQWRQKEAEVARLTEKLATTKARIEKIQQEIPIFKEQIKQLEQIIKAPDKKKEHLKFEEALQNAKKCERKYEEMAKKLRVKEMELEAEVAQATAATLLARNVSARKTEELGQVRGLVEKKRNIDQLPEGKKKEQALEQHLKEIQSVIMESSFSQGDQEHSALALRQQGVRHDYHVLLNEQSDINDLVEKIKEESITSILKKFSDITFPEEDHRNFFNLEASSKVEESAGDSLVSVIAQAATTTRNPKNALSLRVEMAQHLAKDDQLRAKLEAMIESEGFSLHKDPDLSIPIENFEAYLGEINIPGTYSTTPIELIAISRVLKRPIVILTPNNAHDFIIDDEVCRKRTPIFLSLETHYRYRCLFSPEEGAESEYLARIQEAIERRLLEGDEIPSLRNRSPATEVPRVSFHSVLNVDARSYSASGSGVVIAHTQLQDSELTVETGDRVIGINQRRGSQ